MDEKFSRVFDVTLATIGLTLEILALSGIVSIGVGFAGFALSIYHLIRATRKE
ncbi:hypothetical protein [Streptomyces microflavus]|uniref:hypothetical protein n=1 Tax=Streptomyces microflavus TaxID=1919 RepID=UPI0038061129